MPRRIKPPSQTWRAFLRNHNTKDLVSIDFFVVPTATFRVLYLFLVLGHERRRLVHVNLTDGPSAQWAGQQLVNAFPGDSAPKRKQQQGGFAHGHVHCLRPATRLAALHTVAASVGGLLLVRIGATILRKSVGADSRSGHGWLAHGPTR